MPDQEGTLIDVERDVPAPNPKYVVDDSPLKASIVTIMSLLFFGVTLATGVVRLASAGDLNGLRALMTSSETINWLTVAWPTIGVPVWLWIRTRKTWFNKKRDIEIVERVDDSVAMTKTAAAAAIAPESEAPPPTRAPVTTTTTRLVDPVVLHRGGIISAPAPEPQPIVTYDAGAPVADLKPADPAPAAAGPREATAAEVEQAHAGWMEAGGNGAFGDYLSGLGWTQIDGKWTVPTGEE